MGLTRRQTIVDSLFAAALAALPAKSASPAARPAHGMPGLYPGRVISVHHPAATVANVYQAQPVRDMMEKGMKELTGAPSWTDAWRVFFEPGDVVAVKVCPVGGRHICSDALVLNRVIDGLKNAGVRTGDIFVYNRYRREMFSAGIPQWVPQGVRIAWASEAYDKIQHDMDGYDRDMFVELALAMPGQDIREEQVRKSYVARLLSKTVNKVVNVPVLKQHDASGVTIALKNLSHGFVNNVERSHATPTLNVTGSFIPAVLNLPVFREKVVLHIVDAVRGLWEGGPGGNPRFIWQPNTMYFGTDPVALDKIGWKVIDAKRVEQGLPPVASARANQFNRFSYPQVHHIELAGILGLGVFDDSRIDVRRFKLGA